MSQNPYDPPRDGDTLDNGIGPARPTNVRWLVFVLCSGTSWMLYLHRYTFALVKPQLKEEWGLSSTDLGNLDTAFSTCYALFQVPAGIVADVAGAHLFLGGIILLWSVALAMHAWAPNFNVLWGARALFGLGQAGAFASLSKITKNWFPVSIRTTMQGWIGVTFGRFGGVCSNLLFATVMMGILTLSWRFSIYIFAAAGVVLAMVFLALFRNSPRSHPMANQAEADLIEGVDSASQKEGKPTAPPRTSFAEMFRGMSPRSIFNLLSLNGQTVLSTIADNIYSAWIPLFLFEVHKLKFIEMGLFASLPLLGGAIGGACGGMLNDLLIRAWGNRRWARTAVGLTGKGMASVLIFVALLFYDQPYIFCGMLFFVKFFGDWSLTTSWGVVTDIGGKTTATVFAFNNSVASIGAIIAPQLYGRVADNFGWGPVFVIAGVTYAVCAASWLLIDCTIPIVAENSTASDSK